MSQHTGVQKPDGLTDDGYRIADDLFMIGLNDRTGVHVVEPQVLGIGLAGAVLAELVLPGNVMVAGGRLVVRGDGLPPDSLTHAVVELLIAEPEHDLRTWVAFLARDAVGKVAQRLEREHRITLVRSRVPLRRGAGRFEPADINDAAGRYARLLRLIEGRRVPDWPDCVVAGLAHAIGLSRHVLRYSDPDCWAYMDWLVEQLQGCPELREVVSCVGSVAGSRVLSQRK
jgi:hypothetical protein